MTPMHPFRFGALIRLAPSAKKWSEQAHKVEAMGFSTLQLSDHLNAQFAPIPAMATAACATSTLRFGSEVFDNDYRHPAMLAKECATLDLLSEGRLELGIGAGWFASDYNAVGIPFDPPGIRVDRFKEGIAVLKGCFADGPFSFAGQHYTITNYDAQPKPVQRPGPPLFIGGGSKRILRIAGREADIVGLNFSLGNVTPGPAINRIITRQAAASATSSAITQQLAWVREGAGERYDDLEFNVTAFLLHVTDDYQAAADDFGKQIGMSASEILGIPFVLIGSPERMIDVLVERRERFGISYITFLIQNIEGGLETIAPIVHALAGT